MSEFEVKLDGDKMTVVLSGDLTASVASHLKPVLQKSLTEGAGEVTFDLGQTVIIDSTGIGLLIATYNTLAKKSGAVRVVLASDDIYRLLQSMRLETRLCVSKR